MRHGLSMKSNDIHGLGTAHLFQQFADGGGMCFGQFPLDSLSFGTIAFGQVQHSADAATQVIAIRNGNEVFAGDVTFTVGRNQGSINPVQGRAAHQADGAINLHFQAPSGVLPHYNK